jgi:hypothetical protein
MFTTHKSFKYVGCAIFCENEKTFIKNWKKWRKYWEVLLNQLLFRNLLRIKVYRALAPPISLHGTEIWTHNNEHKMIKMIENNRDEIFQNNKGTHTF